MIAGISVGRNDQGSGREEIMTQRNFLAVASVIALIYGVGFAFAPSTISKFYGVAITPPLLLMDRYFGVALLGLAATCWSLKDVADPKLIQSAMIPLGVSNLLGAIVSLHATWTHLINGLGWLSVLIYAGLTAGCALVYRNAIYRFRPV
jgi:hypothetical protein